jgi:hypothetical protein
LAATNLSCSSVCNSRRFFRIDPDVTKHVASAYIRDAFSPTSKETLSKFINLLSKIGIDDEERVCLLSCFIFLQVRHLLAFTCLDYYTAYEYETQCPEAYKSLVEAKKLGSFRDSSRYVVTAENGAEAEMHEFIGESILSRTL